MDFGLSFGVQMNEDNNNGMKRMKIIYENYLPFRNSLINVKRIAKKIR